MAYVRKTDRMVDDIMSNIGNMRRKAQDVHAQDSIEYGTPLGHSLCEAIEMQSWQAKPELRDITPPEWCYHSREIRVSLEDESRQVALSIAFATPKDSPLTLPCKPSAYYDEVRVASENQSPALKQWVSEAFKRKEERGAIGAQFDAIEKQVRAYLKTKSSLNAALKDMPELELYVPDAYMRQFREKSEPRGGKAVGNAEEVFVDRDQLAALGIAHRIATSASAA